MSGMRRLAVIALVGCLCGPAVARADDALVLPKGRSAVSAENLFYVPTGGPVRRDGASGRREVPFGRLRPRTAGRLRGAVNVCGDAADRKSPLRGFAGRVRLATLRRSVGALRDASTKRR